MHLISPACVHSQRGGRLLMKAGGQQVGRQRLMRFASRREENTLSSRLQAQKIIQAWLLSPREGEVLKGLADGLLYKEISVKLGISYAAVHKYQHNLFQKLQVTNRSEAIRRWFINNGVILPAAESCLGTETLSSCRMEKRVERRKSQRCPPSASVNLGVDWKKDRK